MRSVWWSALASVVLHRAGARAADGDLPMLTPAKLIATPVLPLVAPVLIAPIPIARALTMPLPQLLTTPVLRLLAAARRLVMP